MLFSAQGPTETGTFVLPDSTALFTQRWSPKTPRAHVLLVHGYAEHSGRYGHVATALMKQGMAVHAYDQRGFGRSPGRRAIVWDLLTLADDLQAYLSHLQRSYSGPWLVLAHSMGGLVAVHAALRHDLSLRGMVLSGPALSTGVAVPSVLFPIARCIGRWMPGLPTVGAVENGISRDPAVVAEADTDPLNHNGRVPARTGAEIIEAARTAQQQAPHFTLPYLIVHGQADTIVPTSGSARFHEHTASLDKQRIAYDGLRHEVLNEPERDLVLADIQQWIDERV